MSGTKQFIFARAPRARQHLAAWRHAFAVMTCMLLSALGCAQANDTRNGVTVTLPNGYANIATDDLRLPSTAGTVRWSRAWDGKEWKFNPHWESLSHSWANMTGSQSADTTASTVAVSGGAALTSQSGARTGDDGCWVWVDEDWQPATGTTSIGGLVQGPAMAPERTARLSLVFIGCRGGFFFSRQIGGEDEGVAYSVVMTRQPRMTRTRTRTRAAGRIPPVPATDRTAESKVCEVAPRDKASRSEIVPAC